MAESIWCSSRWQNPCPSSGMCLCPVVSPTWTWRGWCRAPGTEWRSFLRLGLIVSPLRLPSATQVGRQPLRPCPTSGEGLGAMRRPPGLFISPTASPVPLSWLLLGPVLTLGPVAQWLSGSVATAMAPSHGDALTQEHPAALSTWELAVLRIPAPFPSWNQSWASQPCPCNSVSLSQSHCLHSPCPPALWVLPGLWLCTGRPLQGRGTDTCSACSRKALPHQQGTWNWGRTAPTSP